MGFSSAVFLFAFLPISVLVHGMLKKEYRNIWLLLCSLFFYGWSGPRFLLLLGGMVLTDHAAGLLIGRRRRPRLMLTLGILVNVCSLFFFKYFTFVLDTLDRIGGGDLAVPDIVLPLGISFYTFKGISYMVDVYREEIPAEENLLYTAVYLCMFPQILSGPIDRYGTLREAIAGREIDGEQFRTGIRRFILGLAGKMILANSLGTLTDAIWDTGAGALTWGTAWLGSIAYSLQIFFDFAGYSSMAVGIGGMLGFRFSENFDLPYLSRSITEFWRRWHMTLGEWFRRYIYIPLGGNRKGEIRTCLNLAAVFLLTGIWHGAAWTFVIWGMLHGILRLAEKLTGDRGASLRIPDRIRNLLGHLYLLFFVNLSWVMFRAPTVKEGLQYILCMFGHCSEMANRIPASLYLDRWNVLILCLAIVCSTRLPQKIGEKICGITEPRTRVLLRDLGLLLLLLLSIMAVVNDTYQTFIYFQF